MPEPPHILCFGGVGAGSFYLCQKLNNKLCDFSCFRLLALPFELPGAPLPAFHSYVASYNLITIPLLSSLPDLACKEQPLNTTTHTLLPTT